MRIRAAFIREISICVLFLVFLIPAHISAQQAIQLNLNFLSVESEGTKPVGFGPELEVTWQTQYIRLDDNLGILLQAGLFIQPRVFSVARTFATDLPATVTPPRYENSRMGFSFGIALNYKWRDFDFEIGPGITQHHSRFKEIDRLGVTLTDPDEFTDWNTTIDLKFITAYNLNRNFGFSGGIKSQHLVTGDNLASTRLSPSIGVVLRF